MSSIFTRQSTPPQADADDIPFARPFIRAEEEEAVLRVLRSGWLTTATETLLFEREFADFLTASGNNALPPLHAYAVNSATSGLHLALEACGVGPGDVVLAPSLTFTSTAGVALHLGAEAAFVDVESGGCLMSPAHLEYTVKRLLERKTARENGGPAGRPKAVVPVHYAGQVCDMGAINAIAKKYGLAVVEDSAHAFPSLTKEGCAGTLGDAGVYSFYATKTLTTGEGGMVVTGNEALGGRIAAMRSHGIDRSVWSRYTDTDAPWYYEVTAPGFKYNLPDILSAIGRVQLKRAAELLSLRKAIAKKYNSAFINDERFIIPSDSEGNAYHLYPLRVTKKSGVSRDEFILSLKKKRIGVSVHFIPLHTMPFYKARYNHIDGDYPFTMDYFIAEVSLPIWPGMTDEQTDRVIGACRG
jgi:dTDP-4-amino-4,6-dideoxygalactose transaminase